MAIDVATRIVAGFHVSLWPPSALSISLTLSHAVLSKTTWLADREMQTLSWPVAGLRVLRVDNAKDFHSNGLVRGCQEYGVQLDHCPRARPHFGGHIERYIGKMMRAVHLLRGTTFSNVTEKADYPSEERARLTLPELERWLALQIEEQSHGWGWLDPVHPGDRDIAHKFLVHGDGYETRDHDWNIASLKFRRPEFAAEPT